MRKIEHRDLDEEIEVLRAMLGTEKAFEETMSQLTLNDEEVMIFKRAVMQLKREKPNPLVIKKAYEIVIGKSWHNKKMLNSEDQSINANAKEKQKLSVKGYIGYVLPYVIAIGFIYLVFFYDTPNPNEAEIEKVTLQVFNPETGKAEMVERLVNKMTGEELVDPLSGEPLTLEDLKDTLEVNEDGTMRLSSKPLDDENGESMMEKGVDNALNYVDKANANTDELNKAMQMMSEERSR